MVGSPRGLIPVGFLQAAAPFPRIDRPGASDHHFRMIANPCVATLSKKAPGSGASDRRAR